MYAERKLNIKFQLIVSINHLKPLLETKVLMPPKPC